MPRSLEIQSSRLRLGISACLLGKPVRWDGASRGIDGLQRAFDPWVEWVEVCPEFELGLGVPRPPIELVSRGEEVRLVRVEDRHDLTDEMDDWVEQRVEQLQGDGLAGFLCKARSPSCGINSTPIWTENRHRHGLGSGRFAEGLQTGLPLLPMADETLAARPEAMGRFVEQAAARARLDATKMEQVCRQGRMDEEQLQLAFHGQPAGAETASWSKWRTLHAIALSQPVVPALAPQRLELWARKKGCWTPALPGTWDDIWALRMADQEQQPGWCRLSSWFSPHPLERRWPPVIARSRANT